jgi:fluoroacetyl-CoA thioesterase
VRPGLSARVDLEVADVDTAESLRTGSVPVLATPRLIALCEEASCLAVDPHLAAGRTTVASSVQFDHLAAVPVGSTVTAEATLSRVEGRRLIFTMSATLQSEDCAGLVGAGRLTRVVVDRETFLAKAGARPTS